MTLTSYGFGEAELREAEWARLAPMLGSPYGYSHPGALAPYIAGGRTIGFGNGSTAGYGVLVDAVNHTHEIPAGAAWWTLCLRRRWGNSGRVSEIVAHQSASLGVPSSRSARPGDVDDQPLAFVQTTATGITSLVDGRQFASKNVHVSDIRAVHDPQLGATYTTGSGETYETVISGAGTVTLRRVVQDVIDVPKVRFGTVTMVQFDSAGTATLRHNLGYRPAWFTFDWEANSGTRPLVIKTAISSQFPDAITTSTVRVFGKLADSNTLYTGPLAAINWTAWGGF